MADTFPVNGKTTDCVSIWNTPAVQGALKVNDTIVDTTDEHRPVLLGAKVGAGIAQRTLIADSHMMGLTVTGDGRLLVLPYCPPEDNNLTTPVVGANDLSVHALIAAKTGVIKIALLALEVLNVGAVATTILLSSASRGELGRFSIPASGGRTIGPFPVPIMTGGAEALNYQFSSAPGANSVFFTPFAYITKE